MIKRKMKRNSKLQLTSEMIIRLMQAPKFVTKEIKHKSATYHVFTGQIKFIKYINIFKYRFFLSD